MQRRALIVGISKYDHLTLLAGAQRDATLMEEVLRAHWDGSPNYDCRLHTSPGSNPITRDFLRTEWDQFFSGSPDAALFYFAGHGTPTVVGGFLATQDGKGNDMGLPMDELLNRANKSQAREVLLVLDCCFSGSLGNPVALQNGLDNNALLREGVTILAASSPHEIAAEVGGQGMFTSMVLHALHGGASDVMGKVSAAAIYAHVDQALGAWDQRPMYKSHASRLTPIRQCEPAVPPAILRQLPTIFPDPMGTIKLDPTYEHSVPTADPAHVAIFNTLKIYRNSRLVRTTEHDDLYYAAMECSGVRLTGLGRFYWKLAKEGKI